MDPQPTTLHVAEWDGYGFRQPAERPPTVLALPHRSYRVRTATVDELLRLLAVGTDTGAWPPLVPNLVWDEGRWCVAAEVDCMSTYVGTALEPDLDAAGLEWAEVTPHDRVA